MKYLVNDLKTFIEQLSMYLINEYVEINVAVFLCQSLALNFTNKKKKKQATTQA